MHELSIARAITETALRHAEARRVTEIRVRIGRLRQVVPDSLGFYLEIATEGTDARGARLELESVEARLRCSACRSEWDPAPDPAERDEDLIGAPRFRCPTCGEGGAEVISGDELELTSIEVEEAPPVAARP